MKHAMVDLETLGTTPGCAILSIGAVFFDEKAGELGDEMYTVVHRPSCVVAGLFEDESTVKWWNSQSAAARQVLADAEMETVAYSIKAALEEFTKFCQSDTNVKVWGNGADFDNTILICAYKAVGLKQGWGPYNGRCYRTIKNLFPDTKMAKRTGTHHNALDDAKNQAVHLIELAKKHKLTLS